MTFGGMGAMGDLSYPAMHCAEYLEMFGDTLVAWSLLEQAVIAHEKAAAIRAESPDADPKDNPELAFYEGKVHTATFFVHQILPRVHGHAERAASQDKSCLEVVL